MIALYVVISAVDGLEAPTRGLQSVASWHQSTGGSSETLTTTFLMMVTVRASVTTVMTKKHTAANSHTVGMVMQAWASKLVMV